MSYKIIKGDNNVSVCMDCNAELQSFIDIFSDDYNTPSPFESVETAYMFAEILVKFLEVVDATR